MQRELIQYFGALFLVLISLQASGGHRILLHTSIGHNATTQVRATAAKSSVPEKVNDGIIVPIGDSLLKVEVCADDVIRVAFAKDRSFFARKSLAAAVRQCKPVPWQLKSDPQQATLSTSRLKVRVDLATGAIAFLDSADKPIVAESKDGRAMLPAEVQGEKTYHLRQQWEANEDETLYGLGQHQLDLMNIKGYDVDLWQHNGTVSVPFLVSSRGYGILWDNTSYTRFGDLRESDFIPAAQLFDMEGRPSGLTGSYYAGSHFDRRIAQRVDPRIDIAVPNDAQHPNQRIHPALPDGDISVRWEGQVEAKESGDYLFDTFSNSGIKVWIDDNLVIDHWRQGWLPWKDVARVHFDAGSRHRLRIDWTKDQGMETMRLQWKTPAASNATSLWSEVGDGVDYYFVYGPELDQVVAGYRQLTGQAPMMPLWAFGLWQSRQRYKTSQESLDVLEGYRSRNIPIDNIVQDWFYWKEDQWGSHQFDPTRFPDPDAWIRNIHDKYHARLLISVWPKFYTGTANFNAMQSRGFLYQPNLRENIKDWVGYPDTFYDAFNPDARHLFWSQVEGALFRKGVDAWWLDASEPDLLPTPTLEGQKTHMHPTALGTGSRMLNGFPLVNSEAVYEGQRSAAPNQRVFILTRSAFAGQQRYAAATWSGDTSATWTAMRKQMFAGLGFSISGLPYWSMDIGGFSVPPRFSRENPSPEDVDDWREMNTRWFQFGAFVPLFRVHGEFPNREMWFFGGETSLAYQTMLKFDRLRYRLLPYFYSLAGAVTQDAGTMMRPLVMDFRADAKAREIGDQYMFGPAFLVNPVTTYKARSRSVYLPQAAGWYDFWTGIMQTGGQTIEAPAPYDSMPLYIRAGSIIPFGPELQYTSEKSPDPITLYVYSGADGAFTLYEDEGISYDYEKGQFARIPIRWDNATRTLTIGKRLGSFPGMLNERTFQLVLVSKAKPAGFSFSPKVDQTIRYRGDEVKLRVD
jgi:alpha-D-xyloside xylohydrolase